MNKIAASLLAALVPCLANAGATLYSDNFDSDATGLNATPSGWTITNGGTVDIVPSGSFGVTCFGAAGNCVDLDGTSNRSGNLTSPGLALVAGQTYTASFELSGNERGAQTDVVAVNFGSAVSSFSVTETAPFTLQTVTFKPSSSGTYNLTFLDNSSDNLGAILDNVSVSAVPEPSTYAMMLAGLIATGLVARRRRALEV